MGKYIEKSLFRAKNLWDSYIFWEKSLIIEINCYKNSWIGLMFQLKISLILKFELFGSNWLAKGVLGCNKRGNFELKALYYVVLNSRF